MSMMEEFLELQEKVSQLENKLHKKSQELDEKDDKLLKLSEKLNDLMNDAAKSASDTRHFRSMVSVLESDKKNLERERNRLLKEIDSLNSQIKQFTDMVDTTNKTLLSKEKQLQEKDALIIEKNAKLEEISEEKVKKFQELSTFMEKMTSEKVQLVEKVAELEKNALDYGQNIKSIRKKSRAAQDGLLGASMEIEKVREESSKLSDTLNETMEELESVKNDKLELETKFGITTADIQNQEKDKEISKVVLQAQKIQKYKEKIATLEMTLENLKEDKKQSSNIEKSEDASFSKGTGTYQSLSALITHFKFKMIKVNRTIRIILPEITDIKKYGLYEIFLGLPKNILKNIACSVNTKRDKKLLSDLKLENFRITNFQGNKLFALSIDNTTAALAVYDEKTDNITGLYSNNEELVRLLSQAIMNPFIKGIKLN